jgi:hypothetical protein
MPRYLQHLSVVLLFCLLLSSVPMFAAEIPRLVEKDGRYALMVDGAPFLVLGAQINNSSAWPATMPKVWPAVEYIHANTLVAPIYWEQMEPRPGEFDWTNVDMLVQQTREHKVRLVLLWFGAWKNGSSSYAPEWIRTDTKTYPRMVSPEGIAINSLSAWGTATLEADKKAFSALMRHLKQIDGEQRTVIMVQVENEPGSWSTVRDTSPEAQKRFEGAVPQELLKALNKKPGTWQQVFGEDANDIFQAYSLAHYIGEVAMAGKAEYPLPMFVNAALRDPEQTDAKPGHGYASGAPVFHLLNVWKAAAKSIDFITPNIYLDSDSKYRKTLELYSARDNALFIAETSNHSRFGRYFVLALGYGSMGFTPFGIDRSGYFNDPLGASDASDETLEPFAENFRLFGPMQREIARLNFEGKLKTTLEQKGKTAETLDFGKWQVKITYGQKQFFFVDNPPGNPNLDGRTMVAQLGPDEFLITGFNARFEFLLSPSMKGQQMQYLRVEEGAYRDGKWQFMRLWNGDQTDWGLNFKRDPYVLKVKLGTY